MLSEREHTHHMHQMGKHKNIFVKEVKTFMRVLYVHMWLLIYLFAHIPTNLLSNPLISYTLDLETL